jgi:hypothetical protein
MKKTQKKAVAIGAGVAALAAAAVGTYLLTGKQGAKNRKKISSFAEKAKKEIAQELKKTEQVTKKVYDQTVDAVAKKYKAVKNIDAAEIVALTSELKSYWDDMSSTAKSAAERVSKAVGAKKAPAKKKAAPKKATKTSAKKKR